MYYFFLHKSKLKLEGGEELSVFWTRLGLHVPPENEASFFFKS